MLHIALMLLFKMLGIGLFLVVLQENLKGEFHLISCHEGTEGE